MARLAVGLALVLLVAASAVFAEDDHKTPPAPSPYRAAIMARFVPLSPAASKELAGAPSNEENEKDPDAASAGSPGGAYPPTKGNILEASTPQASASTPQASASSAASSVGVISSVAVAVTVAVAGYFAL